jgi:hypothetical protein
MEVTELEKVEKGAEHNVGDMRHIDAIKPGQVVRQGDIYIHCVKDDHAAGKETKDRQLALGNTQGSRHIIEGDCKVFEGTTPPDYAPRALLGPLVRLFKRATVTHPEHAHVSLPAGTYQITHQMDARTLERVRD